MGSVVQLKTKINNSYAELKNSVDDKLILVDEKIKQKLTSKVDLVDEMTKYHHNIWGNQSSILVGDYLLSRCFEMMVDDGDLEILKLLSSTSAEISQGEVLQLQHNKEVDILEETYLKIISWKTASLFAASTKVGAILSKQESKIKDALYSYGKNLGLTFQIADDTLDYNSELKVLGKKIGNDFYEGKITLPIILLSQKVNSNEKQELIYIFKKEDRDSNDFKRVLSLISKYEVINECYKKAEYFINIASNSLNIFEESKEKEILKNLTYFSLEQIFIPSLIFIFFISKPFMNSIFTI